MKMKINLDQQEDLLIYKYYKYFSDLLCLKGILM